MAPKKKNNTHNKNAMEPSTSVPPAIEGGGAMEDKQESPAAAEAVTTSRERKSTQESPDRPSLMFEKKLDSADSNPRLSRATVAVHSEVMKQALTLAEEHETPYIRVLAKDVDDRVYWLRLSRNDDVQQGNGEFILGHEWGKLLVANGVREGNIAMGFGYAKSFGDHFRVRLLFFEQLTPPEPEAVFLFEKKIAGAADLMQPAIEFCSHRLKMTLQRKPDIRVSYVDPMERKDSGLSFARHGGGITLRPRWEKFVAENEVEEGDLITGIGTISEDRIGMMLCTLRNAERYLEKYKIPNWVSETFLLFEKTLEYEDTVPIPQRLVIRSCKDEVKEALDKKLKGKDLTAYVRASAIDGKGLTYQLRVSRNVTNDQQEWSCVIHHKWGDVIKSHGLKTGDKIWCWGRFSPDSSIQMKIDVDKESELRMSGS